MSELNKLTITQAREGLKRKEFSSVELTKSYISAMEKHKNLNAYITETAELAYAQAKESDEAFAGKDRVGLLEGIPLGVKDLFCTKGTLTTAASKMLHNFVPPYESTVTKHLFDNGAVMLGKTNLDEFAMGSANVTSHFGNVINPWKRRSDNKNLVPGGSSGGSAAALAAFLCAGALGTDTGGSIRQPCAFTGTVGIKPTYGRCSRWGIVAYASSLDQAGPMARNVQDAAIMLEAMAGFDDKDSTSANVPVPHWEKEINPNLKGKKIGVPREYDVEGLPSEIKATWEKGAVWLKEAGAEIIEISLPHTEHALPTYYIISPAEASSNLARYDGVRFGHRTDSEVSSLDDMYAKTRAEGFGEEVRMRMLIGTYVLSHGYYDAYYKKAQKVRSLIAQDFKKAFEKVDAILTPTTPLAPFAIGERMDDPVAMFINDLLVVPASLAGLPAMSLPAGLNSEGLPLGLQIIGPAFNEQTVFDVGSALEKAAAFKETPEGF